jgi:glycine oxidase
MLDAAIVGGGLIGLSSALALARRGRKVCVIDRGDEAARASWAAGGILGPQSEVHAPSPMLELCRQSFALYPEFVRDLGEVGFRKNGTLHLAFDDDDARALEDLRRWQTAAGLRLEERTHARARLALFFPDEGQVDNRRLLVALREACRREGVELRTAAAAAVEPGRVILGSGLRAPGSGTALGSGLRAPGSGSAEEVVAKAVVVCAGSWSGQILPLPVYPVRGQMIVLDAPPPECVIFGGGGYAVPRGDRTLVGATAEDVGFDATPTAAGRAYLEGVAAKLVPGAHAVVDHWAGLRPATRDTLPLLGRLPNGLIVATGHYRNGVLLAPISAAIVDALFHDESPPVDLAPFHPLRYAPSR